MVEIWKTYKTVYNGKRTYEVSNFGRVKINGVIAEPHLNSCGYKVIAHFSVAKAVAELFIPNPENKPEVDHIDTNRTNDHVNNLKWATHKENINNPLTLQHMSEWQKGGKNPMFGKHHTIESRQKMSESRKGRISPMKGKHHKEETKQKMRKPRPIMRKPKPKYLWLTENGDQIWMDPGNVAKHHKNWKLIQK